MNNNVHQHDAHEVANSHLATLSPCHPAPPLSGARVLVTRAAGQADELVAGLRAAGATPIVCPLLSFAAPEDSAPLDAALRELAAGSYDWLLFSSANGVRFVAERLAALSITPATLHQVKVGVVGTATARAVAAYLGLSVALVPERFDAPTLAQALGDVRGVCCLLALGNLARPVLHDALVANGAQVTRVTAYCTLPTDDGPNIGALLRAGAIDAITLASPSAVQALRERLSADEVLLAGQTLIACIGPTTARAASEAGLAPDAVAAPSTTAGLVAALVELWHHTSPQPAPRLAAAARSTSIDRGSYE
jgi:uroporphyrinogen-III synthase